MSLVGVKARNHTQQVRRHGANPKVDDRATAPEDFARFSEQFGGFTLDVAALPHNAKCDRYFTPEDDGLTQSWAGERVWCNPPYSDIEPWVEKAHAETRAQLIVMLLPANRTEQGWWQRQVEPFRDQALHGLRYTRHPGGLRLYVQFLPGRMRFIAHDDTEIRPNARPPFGCCLLIWRREP